MHRYSRNTEVNVLGYRIERIENADDPGRTARWYEVLAPESGALLGRFAERVQAERHIIGLELSLLHRPVRMIDAAGGRMCP